MTVSPGARPPATTMTASGLRCVLDSRVEPGAEHRCHIAVLHGRPEDDDGVLLLRGGVHPAEDRKTCEEEEHQRSEARDEDPEPPGRPLPGSGPGSVSGEPVEHVQDADHECRDDAGVHAAREQNDQGIEDQDRAHDHPDDRSQASTSAQAAQIEGAGGARHVRVDPLVPALTPAPMDLVIMDAPLSAPSTHSRGGLVACGAANQGTKGRGFVPLDTVSDRPSATALYATVGAFSQLPRNWRYPLLTNPRDHETVTPLPETWTPDRLHGRFKSTD